MKKIIIFTISIIIISSCSIKDDNIKYENTKNIPMLNQEKEKTDLILSNTWKINKEVKQNETSTQNSKEEQKEALTKLLKPKENIEKIDTKDNKIENTWIENEELTEEEIKLAQETDDAEIDKLIDILFEDNLK